MPRDTQPGHEITKVCTCGRAMVPRVNSINGSEFLGCSGYPDCRHTEKIPEAVVMRRAGAMELPGLEG
jgi:ssDNA-binding Zn-finger/Zn-ribbon topoisomerase 1